MKVSGEPVAFADEATTAVVANRSYRITDAAKRVWDPASAVTVYDDGEEVDAEADPYEINRLTGTVIFENAAVRVITVDGDYLPLSTAAEAKDFEFSATAVNNDDSAFGDGDVTRVQVHKDCGGALSQWLSVDSYFADAFEAGEPVILEFSTDGGNTVLARARALLGKFATGGARTGLVDERVTFEGSADADNRSHSWLQ